MRTTEILSDTGDCMHNESIGIENALLPEMTEPELGGIAFDRITASVLGRPLDAEQWGAPNVALAADPDGDDSGRGIWMAALGFIVFCLIGVGAIAGLYHAMRGWP